MQRSWFANFWKGKPWVGFFFRKLSCSYFWGWFSLLCTVGMPVFLKFVFLGKINKKAYLINLQVKCETYNSHHQHQRHRSVERTDQFQKSSPSGAEAAGKGHVRLMPLFPAKVKVHFWVCLIDRVKLTRGKSSGSIQTMLRWGLSVLSSATSFRISRNSKPSETGREQQWD